MACGPGVTCSPRPTASSPIVACASPSPVSFPHFERLSRTCSAAVHLSILSGRVLASGDHQRRRRPVRQPHEQQDRAEGGQLGGRRTDAGARARAAAPGRTPWIFDDVGRGTSLPGRAPWVSATTLGGEPSRACVKGVRNELRRPISCA